MTMSAKPERRRHFEVPADWDQEFQSDLDPKAHEHYRTQRLLQRILRDEYDIRPSVFHATRDLRGVATLTLPELYWLIYEPDDQPPLVCTGAPITAEANPSERFGSPREVQHAAELVEAKRVLAEEFGIYPESAVPTGDMKGRVRLHFDELQKILGNEE